MIFASLIATLITRYGGERRVPVEDETPSQDDSRSEATASRARR